MLPQELDGVTLLVDVPLAGLQAGDVGVIVAITRADDGRLRYTIEIDRPGGGTACSGSSRSFWSGRTPVSPRRARRSAKGRCTSSVTPPAPAPTTRMGST
jgi:hypothetical protein